MQEKLYILTLNFVQGNRKKSTSKHEKETYAIFCPSEKDGKNGHHEN